MAITGSDQGISVTASGIAPRMGATKIETAKRRPTTRLIRGILARLSEQPRLLADRDECADVVEEIDEQKHEHDLEESEAGGGRRRSA
jgi:hypothetical protein